VIVSQAPTRDVGSIDAAPMNRLGNSATICRTSSLDTLPSTPARRPTTTPFVEGLVHLLQQQVHRLAPRRGTGSEADVRVRPILRSPAEYIKVQKAAERRTKRNR
jgi:hypothetical protein